MEKYSHMLPIQTKPENHKDHKFFERFLDNDLNVLTEELKDRYQRIKRAEVLGVSLEKENELWKSSNSVSTMKWREYNVFQFHSVGLYNLYKAISEMTKEACEYYEIDFAEHKFMAQGWFNINYTKKGKLDWHDHGPLGAPNFHGYYCVSAEPSQTHYNVFGKEVVNNNINNRAILSEMGHQHAMADWNWDGPRITVAYDVIPLSDLIRFGVDHEQHWIPLV